MVRLTVAGSEAGRLASVRAHRAVLLYAGSCPKCRFLSRCVELLSAGTIHRVPLERPEWRRFYDHDFPQARGYPVLFLEGRPIFRGWVFAATPLVLVYCLFARAVDTRGRARAAAR